MKINSIKFKISILYTAVFGCILLIYSGILYVSLYRMLCDALDDELREKVQAFSDTVYDINESVVGNEGSFLLIAKKTLTLQPEDVFQKMPKPFEKMIWRAMSSLSLRDHFVRLNDEAGKTIEVSPNIDSRMRMLFEESTWTEYTENVIKTVRYNYRPIRMIHSVIMFNNKPLVGIQIGAYQKPIVHALQVRLFLIALSIPVVIIFTGIMGRLFALHILRPVDEITRMARRITYEDLSARITHSYVDDEIRVLVQAFNDMIARLEKSFGHISEFSSQVSHELKTPLAIMRGETELALRKEQTIDEYKRVLKANLEEIVEMLSIVEELLLLTKLDFKPEFFKFERFNFVLFLNDIIEQSRLLAARKDITVTAALPTEEILLSGDRLHLRRLFYNIIHNAIKFTPVEGTIHIEVRLDEQEVITAITDSGVGITEKDMPRIFDRFFHVDRIGMGMEPGNGLGLSLALSIAKLHQGSIDVVSKVDHGSTFTVVLPLLKKDLV